MLGKGGGERERERESQGMELAEETERIHRANSVHSSAVSFVVTLHVCA